MDHQNKNKRRDFLKNTLTAATGITVFPLHQGINSSMINDNEVSLPYLHRHLAPEVRFGVIGLNHGHIYGQTNAIIRNGGKLVSVYAKEEDLLDQFV